MCKFDKLTRSLTIQPRRREMKNAIGIFTVMVVELLLVQSVPANSGFDWTQRTDIESVAPCSDDPSVWCIVYQGVGSDRYIFMKNGERETARLKSEKDVKRIRVKIDFNLSDWSNTRNRSVKELVISALKIRGTHVKSMPAHERSVREKRVIFQNWPILTHNIIDVVAADKIDSVLQIYCTTITEDCISVTLLLLMLLSIGCLLVIRFNNNIDVYLLGFVFIMSVIVWIGSRETMDVIGVTNHRNLWHVIPRLIGWFAYVGALVTALIFLTNKKDKYNTKYAEWKFYLLCSALYLTSIFMMTNWVNTLVLAIMFLVITILIYWKK